MERKESHHGPPAQGEVGAVTVAQGGRKEMELLSLVLLSANISHRVIRTWSSWRIDVRLTDELVACKQLEAFAEENSGWPPPDLHSPPSALPGWALLALLVGLLLFFSVTGPGTPGNLWFLKGAVDSGLVSSHEQLWRLVTALTLHADINHLLGNVVLGGVVLYYLGGLTGGGAVWALSLVTGCLGNYLNALYRGGDHRFVGFSTAVFGVIGCLCGLRMMSMHSFRLRPILLPLGAGAGLLAMLGTEGETTDVGAHLWGLAVGLAAGIAWHWLSGGGVRVRQPFQSLMFLASVLVVVLSWWLAMGAS